jgi:hypothetical protein
MAFDDTLIVDHIKQTHSTELLSEREKHLIGLAVRRNRSRPVEDFRGWLLVEAGFDGGAEPLEHGAFLQAAGF